MSADGLYDARFAAGDSGRGDVSAELRRAAERLRAQAVALLQLGFEGALDAITVANATGTVPFRTGFPKPPPCCALEAVPDDHAEARRGRPFRCAPGGDATLPADYKYPT